MNKPVNFNDHKELKEGTASPRLVVSLLHDAVEKGDTDPEVLVYVCKMKDGTIEIRHSDGLTTEKIGILQIGIQSLIDGTRI